jgi:hypothetical protein
MRLLPKRVQERILRALSVGQLHTEAGTKGVPALARIHQEREADDDFNAAYQVALEAWGEQLFAEIPHIIDEIEPYTEHKTTTHRDDEGQITSTSHSVTTKDNVARAQLRLAGRQYMLGRINPRKYGDQQALALMAQAALSGKQSGIVVHEMVQDLPLDENDAAALQVLPPTKRSA